MRRRDEALAEALSAVASSPADATLSRSTTLSEFAQWWLRNVAANRVRASSLGKYEDRVERISTWLGDVELGVLRPEQVATMQTELPAELAPQTVADTRSTFHSIMEEAVNLDLVAANPVAKVRPPRVPRSQRRALTAEQGRALVASAASDRLSAAVALLFVQGWRVSEVLALAWGGVDSTPASRRSAERLPTQTASAWCWVRRRPMGRSGDSTSPGRGRAVAPASNRTARGPPPGRWDVDRHAYEGDEADLVFTTATGGLLLRQTVTNAVAAAAERAGIDPKGLGTHGGRSTAITALDAEEGLDLADVARHVGHANAATTAGYVRHLGQRSLAATQAASRLLDPDLDD